MAGTAYPALAQTAWTGASGNDDWFDAGNWDTSAVPDASTSIEVNPGNAIISGNAAEGDNVSIRSGGTVTVTGTGSTLTTTETRTDGGTFNIENGGLVTNGSGIVDGVVTVSGVDGSGNASTWTNNSYFVVGEGATGTLNILDGGKVVVKTDAVLGQSHHVGALVSGNGSSWENTGRLTIDDGSLRIEDGGHVSNTEAIIGSSSAADVIVTGAASTWGNSGQLTVGSYAAGTMRVEDGATVTSSQGYVGAGAGSVGTVTVTGSNSSWEVTDFNLNLGNFGVGSMTIEDGARVFAKRGLDLGVSATDASGTLNINGTPGARGILETSGFRGGIGIADLTIDGGIVRAIDDKASFFSNYGAQQVKLGAGGGIIDTNGHDIGIAPVIAGVGGLTKNGLGTLTLTGENIYGGGTTIVDGTLQLGDGGTTGSILGDITDNGILAFNRADVVTFDGVISGNGAVEQVGSGTTILTADNSYTGGTTITAGTLQLGDGGTTGGILGDVANDGVLAFNRSDNVIFSGLISGNGGIEQAGTGKTTLTADNTFEGNTKIATGTLQLGDGGTTGSVAGDVANDGTLVFDRSNTVVFDGVISGSGIMVKNGAGVLELTANNSYGGATTVNTGKLLVNGDQSAATGLTTVNSGATLGGSGTLGGDVTIADGAILAPGNSPGTLTVNGNLSLASGATLDYQFGEAGLAGGALNDLVNVGGDLILDGTLNVSVSSGGTFGSGIYRVFNYDGTLTDNGLELGTMPFGSDTVVQTSVNHQVNLINTAGLDLNFWDGDAGPKNDGTINGGDGTWHVGGADDNWTETTGTINAPYQNGSFAVFAGASGTVTVDNSGGAVKVAGMQFATDGYVITGDALTLVGPQVTVRVGDGTATGSGYTATIDTELTGTSQLVKTDLGTLVLRGTNTYTGGTAINGGTVRIASDANLGAAAGGLSFDGGTLNTTADITSGRSVDLTGAGTFLTDAGTTATLTGSVSGVGSLIKDGAGNLVITGNATQTGGTTISAGVLYLGNGGTTGSILGNVTNNSILAFNRADVVTFDGTISGKGGVHQIGGGKTILTADNTYTGGTTIADGTLELGDGGTTGSLLGNVTNNGILAFNRTDVVTFDGAITGTGGIDQIGMGTTILTGDSSALTGSSQVQKGILSVNGVLGGSMAVRGGRLQGIGQVGETTNFAGGTIAPGDSIGMLTVAGDYVGSGGTLEIETVLGDDRSATDKLIVTGDTSGNTNVQVINLAGVGAQTVEGIKIIDVAGVSDGSFTLLGNYVFEGDQAVIAGAYAYRLYQGGESTPTDGDWYLRSVLNSETPLYQPLTPIYEVYADVLQSFNELDTLQQRLGNRSWSSGAAVANSAFDAENAGSGMWGRILGRHASIDPRKSTTGANYDVDIWQLQGGADGELYSGGAGDLVGGFSARYGTISADVSSTFGDGSITSTGFGLDGSMTWYGKSGLYLDAQANATWYDSDLSSSTVGTGLISGNDGFGYALGLEAGQQIALGTNWSVTPQAQLTYSRIDYNDFTDTFGGAVSLKDAHKLRGRLGISADYENSWADISGQTRRLHAYGIANLYYDLQSNSDVRVSGVKFTTERAPLWGGLGLGGTYNWSNDRYALYGEAMVDTSLNSFGDSYSMTGRIGLNVKF
ncbi:autotransporter outer membrane beta-barrel domain-containing protein [Shinella sp. M27]|uniref:autotransporter outer membrane beta-barrel domain-containing protein n=1 Tax=Shinella sp. M27 TaxID=3368614 RepID=UPI003BA31337